MSAHDSLIGQMPKKSEMSDAAESSYRSSAFLPIFLRPGVMSVRLDSERQPHIFKKLKTEVLKPEIQGELPQSSLLNEFFQSVRSRNGQSLSRAA